MGLILCIVALLIVAGQVLPDEAPPAPEAPVAVAAAPVKDRAPDAR